ncbi:MAG: RecQ family ATP-dependent DNA helicase [Treponema sp.]|nr:RecQ family ATP-dependent DNA helicase [Treponema sp.]
MTDTLSNAVRQLFGLSYLFPYQRLVITNILEAAEAAGIPIEWPAEDPAVNDSAEDNNAAAFSPEAENVVPDETAAEENSALKKAGEESDRLCLGRQIVILPTGAGKSLCFQLPAMLLTGATLVLYPILSLMADQQRRLAEKGFSPVILRGGQSVEERNAIWGKLQSGESKFIIANPEVLLTPRVMEKLGGLGIVHIVIDEAHCVSEWGESFRPSYLEISKIIEAVKAPLVTAFTATASSPVLEKIEKYIFGNAGSDGRPNRIIGNPDRSNIRYSAQGCILRNLAVRDLLIKNELPAIVFCSSRGGTEKLARYLRNEFEGKDTEIRFYHAGLSREEKTALETWFFSNPRGVLVSTCAYGMGVDKADIRTVIHRDCPPSVEAYLQESGRAGRDGKASEAVLLWGPDDDMQIRRAKNDGDRRRIEGLLAYARNVRDCRREALLKLLDYDSAGDSPETDCCDVCDTRAVNRPGDASLREEKSILNFFTRNRRRCTLGESAKILSRAENIRWSEDDAKKTVRELIRLKKLRVIKNYFWKDKIDIIKIRYSDSKPSSSPVVSGVSAGGGAAFAVLCGLEGNTETERGR